MCLLVDGLSLLEYIYNYIIMITNNMSWKMIHRFIYIHVYMSCALAIQICIKTTYMYTVLQKLKQ